jgi:hypothetical protein
LGGSAKNRQRKNWRGRHRVGAHEHAGGDTHHAASGFGTSKPATSEPKLTRENQKSQLTLLLIDQSK